MEVNKWEKIGREDGRNGDPRADQAPSANEVKIADEYAQRVDRARAEYEREIALLDGEVDQRLLINDTVSETSLFLSEDDDSESNEFITKSRTELQHLVDKTESVFRTLQKDTQDSIDDVNQFKEKHGLVRTANIPESLTFSWGLLAAAVVIETIVNGVFFGEHVAGSVFQGVSIALLASTINVLVLGSLIATMWRMKNHKDDIPKILSLCVLCFLIVSSLLVNVFVAHYRDALPPDQPTLSQQLALPPIVRVSQVALSGEPGNNQYSVLTSPLWSSQNSLTSYQSAVRHECWKGNNEDVASAEAWCLLKSEWFNLDGFMSYMLFIIGLAACGFGAWEFYRMSDPYPGYGKLERKRKDKIEEMENTKKKALEDLENKWRPLYDRLCAESNNSVENWRRSERAIRDQLKKHEDHKKEITVLEKRCSRDIEIYRAANRNERRENQPCPLEWNEPWKADWSPPEDLAPRKLCPFNKAEALRARENKQLNQKLDAITSCFKHCKKQIADMTRLKHYV